MIFGNKIIQKVLILVGFCYIIIYYMFLSCIKNTKEIYENGN